MKNEEVRVTRRWSIRYLIPVFLAAVAIGFLLEVTLYESMTLSDIRLAIVHIPQKWDQLKKMDFQKQFLKPLINSDPDSTEEYLTEQSENETVIIDKDLAEKVEPPQEEKVEVETDPPPVTQELEFWEQPTLLNLNFAWMRNNESICNLSPDGPQDLRIAPILVHTSRNHFEERKALRKTWGSLPIYDEWDIRFVFLIGDADRGSDKDRNQDKFEEQEKLLDEEQQEFGDLVQGSFIDSYKNLTYKHLMGYKWTLNFCRNAEWVFKIDDDMFIDIMRFLDWRSTDIAEYVKDPTEYPYPELYCHTFAGTKPIREKNSKWYASVEDWPDEYYPDYCSGWAYALTVPLIEKIYSVSTAINFFWVDDVFVTGALLEVAMIQYNYQPIIKHIWGQVTGDIAHWRPLCETETMEDSERKFQAVVYIPRGGLFERDQMCLWNKTLHDKEEGSLSTVATLHVADMNAWNKGLKEKKNKS